MKALLWIGWAVAGLFCSGVGVFAESFDENAELLAQVKSGERDEALASWWGFDENDATASLQNALNSGVKRLVIDKMPSDWVVRPLVIPSDIEIILADDVVVRAKPGEFLGTNDSLMTISLRQNVTIRGGNDSVLLMRKSDYHAEPYKLAEWRHGLNIKSSKNIKIENLTIRETGGDGIYLGVAKGGVPCEDVVIKNVFCDANNRQGISVISAKNLLIEDCRLSNTAGTAPAAGIDFEPNRADECLVGCVMRRCVMENNAGDGIELYLPNLTAESQPLDLVIEDCVTRNNRVGLFHSIGNGDTTRLAGSMVVRRCRFENDRAGIRIEGKGTDGHALLLENVTVDLSGWEQSDKRPSGPFVTFINRTQDQYPIGKITLDGLTLIDPLEREPFAYIDQTPFGFGPKNIDGNFTVKKTDDDPVQATTLDSAWWEARFPASNQRALPIVKLNREKIVPAAMSADTTAGEQTAGEQADSHSSVSEEKAASMWVRGVGSWLFYAKAGEPFSFNLTQRKIGSTEVNAAVPTLIAPSGEARTLSAVGENSETYQIDTDETGVWRLNLDVKNHAFAVTACSVPNALAAEPIGRLISTTGTFYFDIPEQIKTFAVRFVGDDGERVSATVIDPAGEIRWRGENIAKSVVYDAPDGCTPGVWSVRFEKPTVGVLEDFSISFYGAAPLLSTERRAVLRQE